MHKQPCMHCGRKPLKVTKEGIAVVTVLIVFGIPILLVWAIIVKSLVGVI